MGGKGGGGGHLRLSRRSVSSCEEYSRSKAGDLAVSSETSMLGSRFRKRASRWANACCQISGKCICIYE